jgi:hypothetical protein
MRMLWFGWLLKIEGGNHGFHWMVRWDCFAMKNLMFLGFPICWLVRSDGDEFVDFLVFGGGDHGLHGLRGLCRWWELRGD